MGQIAIEGMEFYAFHGHFPAERKTGNKFIVDLTIETNLEEAAKSDKLEDTVNYQSVYELVQYEMNINSSLLEHIAKRILDSLFSSFQMVENASLKISKLNPPLGGQIEKVTILMSKSRGNI